MNEQEIRAIVRDEINHQVYQTGTPKIFPHQHNGTDNLRVNQPDIIPGIRANGSITFAQSKDYTFVNVSGNPTSVSFYGVALNTTSTPKIHALVIGNAQLGKSYQFQPLTSSSVVLGKVPTDVIQGCSSLVVTDSNLPGTGASSYTKVSEQYIVYVVSADDSTVLARARIVSINKSTMTVRVVLETNWSIVGLWVIK